MRARAILASLMVLAASPMPAQTGNESRFHSDLRREGEELQACKKFSFADVADCGQTVLTGQPLHIALGSLAPQNGFAAGLAFVEHKDFRNEWRTSFNVDAVATGNGSWRAGAYLKGFRLGGGPLVAVFPAGNGSAPQKQMRPFFQVAPLFNLYAQTTSLNHISFYGLGPNTVTAGQTAFGLTETVAGGSAILRLGRAGVSFLAEVNGRIPRVRGDGREAVPSIEQVYSEAGAPGMASQLAFLEPSAGIRLQPNLFGERLRLHYLAKFQSFAGLGNSHYSFRRWTTDLGHEFPLDKKVRLSAVSDRNGPDACTSDPNAKCPSPAHVSSALNHEGSINIRLLMTGSLANAGSVVPFFFDPTVGGSDLNGEALLPSYADYRFRAPNVVLLRETLEHAVPRVPLGVYFSVDEGKAAMRRNDINLNDLRRSYTVGLTVHAGGLPVVYLLFAWGGGEGHHTTLAVSDVLLGGSARPSLF